MKTLQAVRLFILQLLTRLGILRQVRKQVPFNFADIERRLMEAEELNLTQRRVSPNRQRPRVKISETKRKHRQKLTAAKQRRITRGE